MIDFSKEHKTLLSRLAKNPNDMEGRRKYKGQQEHMAKCESDT